MADPPAGCPDVLEVFTTRPDTLWGVTFLAVAPESAMGRWCAEHGPNAAAVAAYAEETKKKTEIERLAANREKTGVLSGVHAVHPTTGEKLPIYVADYVLASYGTGYVMAVPAHDERDFAFAKARDLPIRIVIQNADASLSLETMENAYSPAGTMVASGPFDGRNSKEAMGDLLAWLGDEGIGTAKVTFRLHDWLISRQRYWGCPIPMVHCSACGVVPVPRDQLPIELPQDVQNFIPEGRSPLADVASFVATTCPKCGAAAERDVDTMDTFIDSSWYHLRFTDAHNGDMPFDPEKARQWLPLDLYIGGAEHANGHLLYFRFITKVLRDAGYLEIDEPVVQLFHHGMVADSDGHTMSKSRGNVVSPIDNAREFGIDASRIAMFFFAPSADEIRWSEKGAHGARKLVQRLFALFTECAPFVRAMPFDVKGCDVTGGAVKGDSGASEAAKEVRRRAHTLLQRFDVAFGGEFALNTGIAGIYELLNAFPTPAVAAAAADADRRCYAESLRVLSLAMAPIAPHLAEEVHVLLGGEGSVFNAAWPQLDESALEQDEIEIAVQVKGKIKARIKVAADTDQATVEAAALADPDVQRAIDGREIRRVIVVPGRLVNVIA